MSSRTKKGGKTQKPKTIAKAKGRTLQSKSSKVVPVKVQAPPVSVGESIGRSVGGFLGNAAQSIIGKIFGLGDYKVKYNSLAGAGGPPQFNDSPAGRSTVITHREYVGDITSSIGFSSTSYAITPTNALLFPWLSQVAANYEEYRIHGMVFEYNATSGQSIASVNTALGTVVMATQYNPNDVPFASKIEMENYEFGTSGAPYSCFMHPIECQPALTVAPQLYVQQPVSAGAVVDQRLTTFGNFNIPTVGMQNANVVGELWVSYQVELLKPRIFAVLSGEGAIEFTATTGAVSNTNLGSLGTNLSTQGVILATNTYVSPGWAVPVLTTAALSSTANQFAVVFGTSNPNGFQLPYSLFNGRRICIAITYNGTTITSNSAIVPGVGVSTITTPVGANAFTATTALSTVGLLVARGTNGALPTDTAALVTFTSPTFATVTSLFVSILIVN